MIPGPQLQQPTIKKVLCAQIQIENVQFVQKLSLQNKINQLQQAIFGIRIQEIIKNLDIILNFLKLIDSNIIQCMRGEKASIFIKFIKILIQIVGTLENTMNFKQMRSITYILISKINNINIQEDMEQQKKINQLRKCQHQKFDEIAMQFVTTLFSYIIKWIDLQNFQEGLIIIHFMIVNDFIIPEQVLLTFNWLIRKSLMNTRQFQRQYNKFTKYLTQEILEKIQSMNNINRYMMKLFANFMCLIMRNVNFKQEQIFIQKITNNFSLVQLLFNSYYQFENQKESYQGEKLLNQQKQDLFQSICLLYIQTDMYALKRLIRIIINIETTTMMVYNCLSIFNTDLFSLMTKSQNVERAKKIISYLQQGNSKSAKKCIMSKKGSWLVCTHENKPALYVIRLQLSHPRDRRNQADQLVFKIQFEKVSKSLIVKYLRVQKTKQKVGYQFYLLSQNQKKSSRESKIFEEQVSYISQSCFTTWLIEVKQDYSVVICSEKNKLLCIQNKFGKVKKIVIGVDEKEKYQSAVQSMYSFYVSQHQTFEKYYNVKNSQGHQNQGIKTVQKKLSLTFESSRQTKQKKLDIFNQFEAAKNNKGSKFIDFQNLYVMNLRDYRQMISHFSGKQKLTSYLLNALQLIKSQSVLNYYINAICKLYSLSNLDQADLYEICFIHGLSLQLNKQIIISKTLSQILCPINLQMSQNYTSGSLRRYLCLVQLILNTLLKSQAPQMKQLKQMLIQFIRKSYQNIKNIQKEKAYEYLKQLRLNLAYYLWNLTKQQWIYSQDLFECQQGQKSQIAGIDLKNCVQTIYRIHQEIVKIFKDDKSDKNIYDSTITYLKLILITLSDASLEVRELKRQYILTILKQCCNILILYGTELAAIKISFQSQQKSIFTLLSQIYNILPVLKNFCSMEKPAQSQERSFEQYFYNIYSQKSKRCKLLQRQQALQLMSKLYYISFQIGSYCMKQSKCGYLQYMSFLYKYLLQRADSFSWEDDPLQLTYNDRIMMIELYASCWKLVIGSTNSGGQKKNYSFDKQNQIQIIEKLNELSLPIYYTHQRQDSVIQNIIQFYMKQNIMQQFPLHILSNINAGELQVIVKKIKQKIDSHIANTQQKLKRYFYLIDIVNNFEHKVNIQFNNIDQYLSDKNRQKYQWFIIYSKIKQLKQIYQVLLSQNQYSNNTQIEYVDPSLIVKSRVKQLIEMFNNEKVFEKIKLILENFAQNQSLEEQQQERTRQISQFEERYTSMFIQILLHEAFTINTNQFRSNKRKLSKKLQNSILNAKTNTLDENNIYFKGQRSQIQQFLSGSSCKNTYHSLIQQVARIILYNNSKFFFEMHSKLAKDKLNTLIAYYRIINRLSLEEKINKFSNSKKYNQYNYYILDDYLSSQNVKVMLKTDFISAFSHFISGDMPRLNQQSQQKISNSHIKYAIKISKNLQELNKNKFFEVYNNYHEVKKRQKSYRKDGFFCYAYLITKSKIYQGKIQIKSQTITFTQNTTIDREAYERLLAKPSQRRTYQQISVSKRVINIQIYNVDYSQQKKYLQKFPAIQIYIQNFSFFFAFQKKQDRQNFLNKSKISCRTKSDNRQLVNQVCQIWDKKQISNFQFLVTLNSIAGRSLNDLSQYYIFPWTVKNFRGNMDSEFLSNEKNFRKLNEPIGTLNRKKLEVALDKYVNSLDQKQIIPHMFGGFYSNSGIVCNFLIRVNPFTTHHYQLQGKQFDLQDRLFTSLQSQFQSVYTCTSDNRELLPQFYCAPQYFRNRNRINFASNPNKRKVDLKMQMPQWVITQSPEQFVLRMRRALESNYVTDNLSEWIDLIFGYKSQLQNAAQYNNLYLQTLYQQNKTVKKKQLNQMNKQELKQSFVKDKSNFIKQLGQVPKNIFGDKSALFNAKKYPEISQNIVDISPQLISFNQQNSQDSSSIKFDYYNQILAISNKNMLLILNTIQDINKYKQKLEEQLQAISITGIKKSKYFLVFTLTTSGKLTVLSVNRVMKGIILGKKHEYRVQNRQILYPTYRFSLLKSVGSYLAVAQDNIIKILKIENKFSKQYKQLINNQKSEQRIYLRQHSYVFAHRSSITNLQSHPGLDIFVSIDQSGLVNVFSFAPQLIIRGTFKIMFLRPSQLVTKIIIHTCGLIVLLTSQRQLLVYNIYGDIIQRVKVQNLFISDIIFFDSNSTSDLIISTKNGYLYQIDLFDILKKGDNCLEGLIVKISMDKKKCIKINQKSHNKIILSRFGKCWLLHVIYSLSEVHKIPSVKQLSKIYATRNFLKRINLNNQYKNN